MPSRIVALSLPRLSNVAQVSVISIPIASAGVLRVPVDRRPVDLTRLRNAVSWSFGYPRNLPPSSPHTDGTPANP